jgi:hypothetical protein
LNALLEIAEHTISNETTRRQFPLQTEEPSRNSKPEKRNPA